ncbi:MAG: hypothetical protein GF398_03035 [Chitinivibrionales bacterium]|nr:hypothetical protein [Chitinivibrionales bacterium]
MFVCKNKMFDRDKASSRANFIAKYILTSGGVAVILFIAGCAAGSKQTGMASNDPPFERVLYRTQDYVGTAVTWAGSIVHIGRAKGCTEIVMKQIPLDKVGFPVEDRYSQGRFIGVCTEPLEGDRFQIGKTVEIDGLIYGYITKPLGEDGQYTFPVLLADKMRLCENQKTYSLEKDGDRPCEEIYARRLDLQETRQNECLETFK